MTNHRAWPLRGLAIGLAAGCLLQAAHARNLPLDKIKLPPGFSISIFADDVPGAREMTLGAKGTLFVGSRSGNIYAISVHNGKPGRAQTLASGLEMPVGVAFRNGALYVSAVSRILRFDAIENHLDHPPRPVVVSDRFPTETHHGWKFIAFGPDGKLYVPVGAPCNICKPDPDRYANIMRMNADGSQLEVFARGIRNSVGFDWDPRTHELWFTNNGRDNLGDNVPSDELDHAPRPGMNFGYPYCHAGDIPDPKFGKEHRCSEFTPPALKLDAHVAPLGMRFYTGKMFPPEYHDNVFIAEHGSWNRSTPVGYRVERVVVTNSRVVAHQPFATGWLQNGEAWGRPADVLVMPDGALLVSDDQAGVIYRIAYSGAH